MVFDGIRGYCMCCIVLSVLVSISQYQSIPVSPGRSWSVLVRISQSRSVPVTISQYQSVSVSIGQSRSVPVSPGQSRSRNTQTYKWDWIGLDGVRVVGGIEHLTVLIIWLSLKPEVNWL